MNNTIMYKGYIGSVDDYLYVCKSEENSNNSPASKINI